MRIVVSGYYGYDNVGDEAILESLITTFRSLEPGIEIVVLSGQPETTAARYRVEAVNRWNLLAVWKAIKASDGLVSGGGTLLQDVTGRKSVPYYAGIMQMAAWLDVPFVVYAQGIGPVQSRLNQSITRRVLTKASLLTVRDQRSKAQLLELGIKQAIDIVPDPAFGLSLERESTASITISKQPMIAVALREWTCDKQYWSLIVKALALCRRAGFQLVFVPMHGEKDEEVSQAIVNRIDDEAVVLDAELPIREKAAAIAKANVLVGMRLHSLIFAALANVPFVALAYDPKVDSFAEQCKQPIFNVSEINWSEEDLFAAILDQYENREEIKEELAPLITTMKANVERTAERALALFRSRHSGDTFN